MIDYETLDYVEVNVTERSWETYVYIDGKRLDWCIKADAIKGEAEVYLVDKKGKLYTHDDELVRVTLKGKVRIVRRKI